MFYKKIKYYKYYSNIKERMIKNMTRILGSKYQTYINDELVDTEVVNENSEENTIELKFETDSITPDLEAQIYVDAMGRDVEFGIIPKEETLNLVQAIEEVVEVVEAENTNEETSNEEAEQKSEKSSNKSIFIGIGAVIALAILVVVIRRVKK